MVKPRIESAPISNTTRLAVAVLFVAALVILVVQFRGETDATSDTPQSIHAKEVTWTCERDLSHTFKNRFRYDPLPCRVCDGKCYIQLEYTCPVHDRDFGALVEFGRPADDAKSPRTDGVPVITRYRHLQATSWRTSDGTIPCPVTGCKTASRRREVRWSTTKVANTPHD